MNDIYWTLVTAIVLAINIAYYWIIISLNKIRTDKEYNDMPVFPLFWHRPAFSWAFKRNPLHNERVETLRKALRNCIIIGAITVIVFFIISVIYGI